MSSILKQLEQYQKVAIIRLILTCFYFISCILIPFLKIIPFITWKFVFSGSNSDFFWIYNCYIDGIEYKNDNYNDPSEFFSYLESFKFFSESFLEEIEPISFYLFDLLYFLGWTMILSGSCVFILNILIFYQIFHKKKSRILPISHLLSTFSIVLVFIEWVLFLLFIFEFNCPSFGRYYFPPEYYIVCMKPTFNFILSFLMVFGIVCLFTANYIDFFTKNFVTRIGKKETSFNLETLQVTISDL